MKHDHQNVKKLLDKKVLHSILQVSMKENDIVNKMADMSFSDSHHHRQFSKTHRAFGGYQISPKAEDPVERFHIAQK